MTKAFRALIMTQDVSIGRALARFAAQADEVDVTIVSGRESADEAMLSSADVLLWMPSDSYGFDWVQRVNERWPRLYIVALFPRDDYASLVAAAFQAGIRDFIAWPCVPLEMAAALHRAQVAIAYRQDEAKLDLQQREIEAIHLATNAIASSADPDQVLTEILVEIRQALGAESASLLLVDEKTNNLYFLATSDGVPKLAGLQVPKDRGVASWSVREGQIAIVNDVAGDPRFYRGIDAISGYRTRNLLAAPLVVCDRIIGAVEAVNRIAGSFDHQDAQLLARLAMTAAATIQNAFLYADLQASRDLLEAVLDTASNGMAAVDQDGTLLFHNPATERLFGVRRESDYPKNLYRFVERYGPKITVLHPQNKTWEDYRDAIISAVNPVHFVLKLEVEPPRILDCSITPMSDHGGGKVTRLLSWRDVTNEREMEKWREDLTHIIVHDLRNPLSLVRVGIEASQMFLPPDTHSDVLQGLTLALQGVTQLERKTDVLLAVNELETGRRIIDRNEISLHGIIDDVLAFYQFEATERGIQLEVDAELRDLPTIQGDRDMIEWCVGNLVYYAVKHSGRPGRVRISAQIQENNVKLVISSENATLGPEEQERLFAKYAQPSAEHHTSTPGVGLYFCDLAISAHQGEISLVTHEPKGYQFEIQLPCG